MYCYVWSRSCSCNTAASAEAARININISLWCGKNYFNFSLNQTSKVIKMTHAHEENCLRQASWACVMLSCTSVFLYKFLAQESCTQIARFDCLQLAPSNAFIVSHIFRETYTDFRCKKLARVSGTRLLSTCHLNYFIYGQSWKVNFWEMQE